MDATKTVPAAYLVYLMHVCSATGNGMISCNPDLDLYGRGDALGDRCRGYGILDLPLDEPTLLDAIACALCACCLWRGRGEKNVRS